MATVEKNGAITIEGIDELNRKLEQMKTTDPTFEKRLRGAIRKVLGQVRAAMQKSAQSDLGMQSDPRHAYKAVRYAVYKRIFGGQVNILQSQRASGHRSSYEPPRKPMPRRGGNRMVRSKRTQDLMSYEGADRGFILRFLNAGTEARYTGGRNGRTDAERTRFIESHEGRGFRGSIAARNWFGPRSQKEMEAAAQNIQAIIDKVINDEFK